MKSLRVEHDSAVRAEIAKEWYEVSWKQEKSENKVLITPRLCNDMLPFYFFVVFFFFFLLFFALHKVHLQSFVFRSFIFLCVIYCNFIALLLFLIANEVHGWKNLISTTTLWTTGNSLLPSYQIYLEYAKKVQIKRLIEKRERKILCKWSLKYFHKEWF